MSSQELPAGFGETDVETHAGVDDEAHDGSVLGAGPAHRVDDIRHRFTRDGSTPRGWQRRASLGGIKGVEIVLFDDVLGPDLAGGQPPFACHSTIRGTRCASASSIVIAYSAIVAACTPLAVTMGMVLSV